MLHFVAFCVAIPAVALTVSFHQSPRLRCCVAEVALTAASPRVFEAAATVTTGVAAGSASLRNLAAAQLKENESARQHFWRYLKWHDRSRNRGRHGNDSALQWRWRYHCGS